MKKKTFLPCGHDSKTSSLKAFVNKDIFNQKKKKKTNQVLHQQLYTTLSFRRKTTTNTHQRLSKSLFSYFCRFHSLLVFQLTKVSLK